MLIPDNIDLIISRHGETILNELIKGNGGYSKMKWENNPQFKKLTPKGREQATTLGRCLKDSRWFPDIFLTSTSARAVETAELCASELGLAHGDINFVKMDSLRETCCFEYINDHIPNHQFRNMSSYEEKIIEAQKTMDIFSHSRYITKKILFIGHELRNTFLLDAMLSRKTKMTVADVYFPNCGIQLIKRTPEGNFVDIGGAFNLGELAQL